MSVQPTFDGRAGTAVYPPSRLRSRARPGPAVRATPWLDIAAYVASLGIILIYSQSWAATLTGYGARSADFLRHFYYPAYAMALFVVLSRPGLSLKAVTSTPWLILLIALTALSSLWSIDPAVTQRRLVALSFTTLGGVALAVRWQWKTLIELFALAFAIMAVASLILGGLLPNMGRMQEIFPGAWRGLWLEKNALGENMGLSTIFALVAGVLTPRRRYVWFAIAAISAGLVVLSTSKTGLVVMLIALCSLAFVALVKRGPGMAVIATWLSLLVVGAAATFILLYTDVFLDILGKDATLTGRTEIWGGIIRHVQDRMWTGVGYGVAWDDESATGTRAWIAHEAKFIAAHAHNGWMELYLGLGLPGVILFGCWFTEMWGRSLWAAYSRISGWILVPMMTAYTLTMMTESITMVWHSLRWVLFVALALRAAIGTAEPAPPVVTSSRRRQRPF